jgi:hypothetical protein
MGKANDLLGFMNSLKCLIVFEKKTCSLYEDVAEGVNSPLIKSLLLYISLDCQKHSTVLRGISLSMPRNSWKPAELPKATSEALRSIDAFQIELSNVSAIPKGNMSSLCAQLTSLADSLAAEYNSLLQLNILECLSMELSNSYKMSLESLKTILLEFLHEEEYHREILAMVMCFLEGKDKEEIDNTPTVRFRDPDCWSRPTPMTA